MTHTRGRPYHPMTQGKIEPYHGSMQNQILLENYHLSGELEAALSRCVGYYNYERYHESPWIISHPPTFTTGALRRFYPCGRTSSGVRSNGAGSYTTNEKQLKWQPR